MEVTVVGAGLAGCEAAHTLAERGVAVRLVDMKPHKRTPAQTSDTLCELVCSNSMRGAALSNAVGLLKEELRRMGSLIVQVADRTQVPAGGALAVDRDRFSAEVTRVVSSHPKITIVHEEVTKIPDARPVILATGPLTSDALAADLERTIGASRLAYYDAIAPIVASDSINWSKVWRQSRYGKGEIVNPDAADGAGDEAYVNCPFEEAEYRAFVAALVAAERVEARAFEEVRYFEGCLPCEVMAERGEMTLAFGPMKPVGLTDPRTGKRPHAVMQLRPEDGAATAYNLVGFQTRMKWGDQARVFRMVPGLEEAEFMRMGSIHRNTFLDAPNLLDPSMQLKVAPGVFVAGQVSGVEGYVESAAGGFLCALMLTQRLLGQTIVTPPPTTALGGLLTHLGRVGPSGSYQPSNITWAHLPPLADGGPKMKKRARYELLAERALVDLASYAASVGVASAA